MTRDDRPDLEAWTSQLTEPFRGRPVIVAFHVLAGMTSHVARLEEWGAERPLLVARGIGTGPLPSPDDADIYQLPLEAATSLRLAPLHLKALQFADQHWDRDFGELEAAPDVR